MDILCRLITLYYFVVIGRIILSLVVNFGRMSWDHPVRRIEEILAKAVDPVLRPIRSFIPSLPVGGMALDLSPLVLLIGLSILQQAIC